MTEKRKGRPTLDYSPYLFPGEVLDGPNAVSPAVLRKRKFDRKQKQTKENAEERSTIPDAITWGSSWDRRFPQESEELKQFVSETTNKITLELQLPANRKYGNDIDYIIEKLCMCSLGFKKNTWIWVRKTNFGFSVAGFIPTYFGDDLVPLANYYGLKKSETFLVLYNQVLPELEKRYGMIQDTSAALVKQELSGNYKLPAKLSSVGVGTEAGKD
jgi:hypothetical protein